MFSPSIAWKGGKGSEILITTFHRLYAVPFDHVLTGQELTSITSENSKIGISMMYVYLFWAPLLGKLVGVIFNPKIYIADFGPLYRALNRDLRKKLQYRFPKMASLHFLLSRNSLKKVQLIRVMRNGRSQLCTKQTKVLFMSYGAPTLSWAYTNHRNCMTSPHEPSGNLKKKHLPSKRYSS